MTEKKYSLKSNAMHRWLYSRKVDPVIVADRLRMRVSVFKRMIKYKIPFEEEQIRRLVYFMGAKSAFDVIYFATPEERERVRKATFGDVSGTLDVYSEIQAQNRYPVVNNVRIKVDS